MCRPQRSCGLFNCLLEERLGLVQFPLVGEIMTELTHRFEPGGIGGLMTEVFEGHAQVGHCLGMFAQPVVCPADREPEGRFDRGLTRERRAHLGGGAIEYFAQRDPARCRIVFGRCLVQ